MAVQAKISAKSRDVACEIMKWTGEKQIEVIEHALLVYRRQCRMQSLVEAFDELKGEARRSYQKESKELEGTIGDGLDTTD